MRSAFSVTFDVAAMLSLLLAGLTIYGQPRDWEIPFVWSVVLGCSWLAILLRVVAILAGVFAEARSSALKSGSLRDEEKTAPPAACAPAPLCRTGIRP